VQKTLSPVLKAKALDNRLPDPILGDAYAEQVMRRLDPGYDKGRFGTSQLGLAAVVRAKAYDDWARSFLADHPDAVVLHLGCGLDARVYRIDPPRPSTGTTWTTPPSSNCGGNSCRRASTAP
jgi:O-methyltransferase involved in polyketide biosynthesis